MPEQTVNLYKEAARDEEQLKAEKQQQTYADVLQSRAQRPDITGRDGEEKGRREQTYAEYQAAKKEKEEKEPEKYEAHLRPTRQQTYDLTR